MKDEVLEAQGAAEWFLAIHAAEDPPAETLEAWLRWLEASQENRQAFEEVAQVWHNTPAAVIARCQERLAAGHYDGSISIAEWRERQRQGKADIRPEVKGLRVRGAKWRRPALAMAAAALAAVGFVSYEQLMPQPITQGEFVTRTGEHRELKLADGSQVILGGHSRLRVDFGESAREVHLESGEAYFSVAKDPGRPFSVLALEGVITALGTAFNVRALEDRVTVTVTEGSVKISDGRNLENESIQDREIGRLKQGEQLTYEPHKSIPVVAAAKIERVDIKESVRWREGWFVYRDEPLKYVVADMARYTDLKLQVAESAEEVRFSGAVSREHIGEWIVALPEVAGVLVRQEEGGFTISAHPGDAVVAR